MLGDHDNQISRDDYAIGFTLYCFNLTQDLSSGETLNLVKQRNLRIKIPFAKPLNTDGECYVVGRVRFDAVIKIDHSRTVLFDYNA